MASEMNANERFEQRAAAFHREAGMMAPGKDDCTGHHSYAERWDAFRAWLKRQAESSTPPAAPTEEP